MFLLRTEYQTRKEAREKSVAEKGEVSKFAKVGFATLQRIKASDDRRQAERRAGIQAKSGAQRFSSNKFASLISSLKML